MSNDISGENVSSADGDVRYVRRSDSLDFGALAHEGRYHWAREFLDQDADVLDFGCGSGYGASILAPLAANYLGLDISPVSIAFAERTYASSNASFGVEDLQARDLPGRIGRKFDLVVSFDVIEHVERYYDFCANISEMLKPEGVALIGCPNRLETFTWNAEWNAFHMQEFTPHQLDWLLGQYFEEVELLGQDFRRSEQRDAAVRSMRASMRSRIARFGPAVRAVRALRRVTGRNIGGARTGFALDDIDFRRESDDEAFVRRAFGLVSICRCPRPVESARDREGPRILA